MVNKLLGPLIAAAAAGAILASQDSMPTYYEKMHIQAYREWEEKVAQLPLRDIVFKDRDNPFASAATGHLSGIPVTEYQSGFSERLRAKGLKNVLLDSIREPTTEEETAIEEAYALAPYCLRIINALRFTDAPNGVYSGFASGSNHIAIPEQVVGLDKPLSEDMMFNGKRVFDKKTVDLWKNYKGVLQDITLHECGHSISQDILYYYNRLTGNDYFGMQFGRPWPSDDIMTSLPWTAHPLYKALAKLEMPLYQGNGRFADERLREYFNHGEEYFAELFAISRLKPEFLTDEERRFFDRLHQGLMSKGERFLVLVAANPDILLHDSYEAGRKPSVKALQYSDSNDQRFYQNHGYSKEPPKKLGMKGSYSGRH